MFLDDNESSEIATLCKGISADTNEADFIERISFDPEVDNKLIEALSLQIEGKRKLDIPKRKSQLGDERQSLKALVATLEAEIGRFNDAKLIEINQVVEGILDKRVLVQGLSTESFDDGILRTIGSPEWKALIVAARALSLKEQEEENRSLDHCMLCHQTLASGAKVLFAKYWEFLESKAESELAELLQQHQSLIESFRLSKLVFPKFLETDAGVKILKTADPEYFEQLIDQFKVLESLYLDWEKKISEFQKIESGSVPTISLTRIEEMLSSLTIEEGALVDPSVEISELTGQLNSLSHRKAANALRTAASAYIQFQKWLSKVEAVNFPGIKMAMTRKRTEAFLVGVAQGYKRLFNEELAKFGCDFDLVMSASGEQGKTKKEYRLEFAEDYIPSQILSEGEQKVCSLADFLTEIQIDKNNCGIIFDDPVTSLDHERKSLIAKRLAVEALVRQVVIFTHDIVFMGQLVGHADKEVVPVVSHWMRSLDGVPGHVESNTSPRLARLVSLKKDSNDAVHNFASLNAKDQERALGVAFDYLRSACEALIEEVLFANTIERYTDHVKVHNLEEAVFDQAAALNIVEMHGKISEVILAHNRSDQMRENPPSFAEFELFQREFQDLEKNLRDLRKKAQRDRELRKAAKASKQVGW